MLIGLLIVGFEIINLYLLTLGHPEIIFIEGLIRTTEEYPYSQIGIWILFMLASTLIPTFLHFAFAILGLSVTFIPQSFRNWLISCLEGDPSRYKLRYPAIYNTTILPFSIAFVVLLFLALKAGLEIVSGHGDVISTALTSFSYSIINLMT